jgi:hypothetical protein
MLPVEVAAFQRDNFGPDGKRLRPDGDLGPKTQWAMALVELPVWRHLLVTTALQHVGLVEVGGENHGPEIERWLEACGVEPGLPWCAAFVSAMLRLIGIECAEARVSKLVERFPETLCPLPGDLGYWLREDGTGHVGIVTGVDRMYVSLVEGNSGDGVRVVKRHMAGLKFLCPRGHGMPRVWGGIMAAGSKTV